MKLCASSKRHFLYAFGVHNLIDVECKHLKRNVYSVKMGENFRLIELIPEFESNIGVNAANTRLASLKQSDKGPHSQIKFPCLPKKAFCEAVPDKEYRGYKFAKLCYWKKTKAIEKDVASYGLAGPSYFELCWKTFFSSWIYLKWLQMLFVTGHLWI